MQVVLLGTGTPNADPQRSGPAVAIIVNNTAYLVDFGPGVVRRAVAASNKTGIVALEAKNLKRAFLTHLHSDHVVGYPDLIFTPWVLGRDEPLDVYGPPGTQTMTDHLLLACKQCTKLVQIKAAKNLEVILKYPPQGILNCEVRTVTLSYFGP